MKSFSVKCAHEVDKMDGYCSYERWNETVLSGSFH